MSWKNLASSASLPAAGVPAPPTAFPYCFKWSIHDKRLGMAMNTEVCQY